MWGSAPTVGELSWRLLHGPLTASNFVFAAASWSAISTIFSSELNGPTAISVGDHGDRTSRGTILEVSTFARNCPLRSPVRAHRQPGVGASVEVQTSLS